jgi:uncharacterized membrane protein YcaP (DUF421 family)
MLEGAMRSERVTREELLAVLRTSGKPDPDAVTAVVLETDGSFSVLSNEPVGLSRSGSGADR